MLLRLTNSRKKNTIAEKWEKINAPLYIGLADKAGYVNVLRKPNANPKKAFIFLLKHLNMPDAERNKFIRKFQIYSLIEPENTYEKFLGEPYITPSDERDVSEK